MSSVTHYEGCWRDPKHHACAVREIERLRSEIVELTWNCGRLREELDRADRIANGWGRQVIEIRNLLRFFFDNVPVQYHENHENYAEVMKRTAEILGHGRDC